MEPVYIWLILAVALLVGELLTPGFLLACFSLGAFLAVIPAAFHLHPAWQIAAFCVGSLLSLWLLRPFVMRISKRRPQVKTGVDALPGSRGRVVRTVTYSGKEGRVAIDGDEWPARTEDPNLTIPVGAHVKVLRNESITLFVTPEA